MVFQNPDNQLVASVVEEDVAFGAENLGVPSEEIRRRVDLALECVGLSGYERAMPSKLSGGQKQRVAIAGILAMKPKCIILDEATSMLDPEGRREVMELVTELNKRNGITVIAITHYMDEAAMAERIIVMNKGKVALCGKPAEVFSHRERLKELSLELPEEVKLCNELRLLGRAIPSEVLNIAQLKSELKKIGVKSDYHVDEVDEPYTQPSEPILSVNDVSYAYSDNIPTSAAVLKDINIDIQVGEIIGIIGHTGSGKSTLVQHLNGLIKAQSGTVEFKGKDINEVSDIKGKVGLVFQYPETQIFEQTVFDEIAFGPKNMGLTGDELNRCVSEAMELVGLDSDMKDKSPFGLSGGQMRRVAIAGVLAMKPEVLALDEPMAGLDPKGRLELISLLKKIRSERGTSIVLVAHSMDEIAAVADRLIVMSKGEIKLLDTTKRVFKEAELLESIGLGVPVSVEAMKCIKELGADVPVNILDIKEAAQLINNALI
jgi:energy-coupling factor transport system ATP-binding protein